MASHLDRLQATYAGIGSVTLTAAAEVTITDPGASPERQRTGQSTLVYHAAGERHFVSSRIDPALGLFPDFDAAYDGRLYQMFLPGPEIITIHREDSRMSPSVIPNPFLLPVSFLVRRDDSCPACSVRLVDAQSPALWEQRADEASFVAYEDAPGRPPIVRFPGGTSPTGGLALIEVTFGGQGEVGSIRQVGPGGATELLIELGDYRPVGRGRVFPHHARFSGFDPDDESLRAELEINVEELIVDGEVDASLFRISQAQAQMVWDGDRNERFVEIEADP